MLDDRDWHLTQVPVAIAVAENTFVFAHKLVYQERARVNRRLRNKSIWRGNSKEARKERRQAEEGKVVVKASGLSERELGPL